MLMQVLQAAAQSYQPGRRIVQFTDPDRANRVIATDLFYPAATAGDNQPLAGGLEKFPVVSFGHGFSIGSSSYYWLGDSLARRGFIVALPATEGSFSPSHAEFGRDLAFLCSRLISLNDSSASFLSGRVMNRSATGGHSMGGGASFLAMNYNSNIHALFNFTAAETNPSAMAASLTLQKPALIFAGSSDCIVRDTVQQRLYNSIPYGCKTFINITNALHCHFASNNAACVLGQLTTGCNSSPLTAADVNAKVMLLLAPFLDHYLKNNCARASDFVQAYNSITGVSKMRSCVSDPLGCQITSVNNPTLKETRLYPNPLRQQEYLTIEGRGLIRQLLVFNMQGQKILEPALAPSNNIRLQLFLPPGSYLVQFKDGREKVQYKLSVF
jgi:dienelactone hydrolase